MVGDAHGPQKNLPKIIFSNHLPPLGSIGTWAQRGIICFTLLSFSG